MVRRNGLLDGTKKWILDGTKKWIARWYEEMDY